MLTVGGSKSDDQDSKSKLESIQMLNKRKMDQYIMVYLHSEMTYNNEKIELLLHTETWI